MTPASGPRSSRDRGGALRPSGGRHPWWQAGRAAASPGLFELPWWILVVVLVPIGLFDIRGHPWHVPPDALELLWGSAPLALIVGFMAGRRWAVRTADERGWRRLLAATAGAVAGGLVGAVYVGLAVAIYRVLIPVYGDVGAPATAGVLLGVLGAAVAQAFRKPRTGTAAPGRRWYVIGGIVGALGVIIAPLVVRRGAQFATIEYLESSHSYSAGPGSRLPDGSLLVRLPRAGRFAIYDGWDPALRSVRCGVTGDGLTERPAAPVAIPPVYGDSFSIAWIASFDVPKAGDYTVTCHHAPTAEFAVGDPPRIRGLVAVLVDSPLPVTRVLGAVPGLMLIAAAARRRMTA